MANPTLAQNLTRLLAEAQQQIVAAGLPDPAPQRCADLSRSLPLAHAMPSAAFVEIAKDTRRLGWKLFSPAKLDRHGIKPLRLESDEVALGTQNFVFLYCGQVRYPETQVGFLFATSLESDRGDDSEASPFDSGALHKKVTWPDATETATTILARHAMPVPAYREHLMCRVHLLFAQPEDYVSPSKGPIRPDPIGLQPRPPATTADPRLWTFEVRVPDEVPLGTPHLAAVFYSARLVGEPAVRNFLAAQDAVHVEEFTADHDGDFATLQRRCLEYLRKQGILK